jgi:hypothetical protein
MAAEKMPSFTPYGVPPYYIKLGISPPARGFPPLAVVGLQIFVFVFLQGWQAFDSDTPTITHLDVLPCPPIPTRRSQAVPGTLLRAEGLS